MTTTLTHLLHTTRSGRVAGKQGRSGPFACVLPVVPEHVGGPLWLVDRATGQHLPEDRHKVDDRCAVIGVQVDNVKIATLDPKKPGVGRGNAGWPPMVAVHETTGGRPGRVVARTARFEFDVLVRAKTEVPGDLEVAELLDPLQCAFRDAGNDADDRLNIPLVVVAAPPVPSDDSGDHRYLDGLVEHTLPFVSLRRSEKQPFPSPFSLRYVSARMEHCLGPSIQFRSLAACSVSERGQCPSHLDYRLPGSAGLHAGHGVERLSPGVAGDVEMPLLCLDGAEVPQGDRVRPRKLCSTRTDAAAELLLGALEVAEVTQRGSGLVGKAGLGEEENPVRFIVSCVCAAKVPLGL